jgi:hypothetical protein
MNTAPEATKPEDQNEFGMFAPTTAEDAATQSNTNKSVEVVADILKPGVNRHTFVEGDNWMRFINTRGSAWFEAITYYEMRAGNRVARVAHQDLLFGDINLLLAVQIGLYQNPLTRPKMNTRETPNGFKFRDHRKAYMLASRWENTLSPFGVVAVTLGKLNYGKGQKYREAWGDALIKLPAEMTVDPTLEQSVKPQPRWGSIFDPVDGRLVKCSFTNFGSVEISANFTPAERTLPLGAWETRNDKKVFIPNPKFKDVLRGVPSLRDCFRRLTVEEQMEIVRIFVPADLLPFAEKIMQDKLAEGRSGRNQTRHAPNSNTAAPASTTATTAAPAAAATASTGNAAPADVNAAPQPPAPEPVQIPVPAEEPPQISETDKLYLELVRELGPKFAAVGEETARKLIKLTLVNPSNVKQMASFQPDILKTLATAGH